MPMNPLSHFDPSCRIKNAFLLISSCVNAQLQLLLSSQGQLLFKYILNGKPNHTECMLQSKVVSSTSAWPYQPLPLAPPERMEQDGMPCTSQTYPTGTVIGSQHDFAGIIGVLN